jgi:hypothetical protein
VNPAPDPDARSADRWTYASLTTQTTIGVRRSMVGMGFT